MDEEKPKRPPLPEDAESRIATHLRILRTQGEEALERHLEKEEEERRKPFTDAMAKKES
jgi:hypothetical protein